MAAYFFMKGKKMKKNPMVTIKMENGKLITVELFPEIAPNTVNNFISLINKRFYNGLIFHRVISDFMIQGGCPKGMGHGGPDYCIKGEFFGKVVEGMDEVDRIANVKKDRNDKPIIPEIIKDIAVNCFGEDYPEPEIEMS